MDFPKIDEAFLEAKIEELRKKEYGEQVAIQPLCKKEQLLEKTLLALVK